MWVLVLVLVLVLAQAFIVDDRVDVALALDADGVHVRILGSRH